MDFIEGICDEHEDCNACPNYSKCFYAVYLDDSSDYDDEKGA